MSGTKSTRLTPKLYAKLQGDSTNNIKVTMETIESLRTEHKLIEDDINNKKLKHILVLAKEKNVKEEIENDKRINRGIAIDLRNKQRCVSVEVSFLNKLNAAVKKDGSKYTTSVNYKKRYVKTSRNKSIFS